MHTQWENIDRREKRPRFYPFADQYSPHVILLFISRSCTKKEYKITFTKQNIKSYILFNSSKNLYRLHDKIDLGRLKFA